MNPAKVNTVQQFDALFNNAAIGIIIANQQGNIVAVNQFALGQFGYKEEELINKKIELLVPPRYTARHEGHRANYHAHAHSRPMGTGLDLQAVRKGGAEFPVEVSLSSYTTAEGNFAIAFIYDISLRKESESALIKLNAELEEKIIERTLSLTQALAKEKELNDLKSKFVSLASHEFRTPLSTILSSAYLLSKYELTEDQPKRDKHIDRIVSSVTTLTDILNDFLSVGKIEEGKLQVRYADFDLPETTAGIIAEMNTNLKEGQQITYNHEGENITRLDPTLYKHIIMNLLSNAIKFSMPDGCIRLNTIVGEDECTLSVKDDGIGISEEDMQHLFERFFRGANVSNIQGTGLGLHIVGKYAELMEGTIKCNSILDSGTEFIVNFKVNKE
jgi:PAS domain S-box-containing protein